jgi:uncharacterized membrane protein HdeD (DUF308 family)
MAIYVVNFHWWFIGILIPQLIVAVAGIFATGGWSIVLNVISAVIGAVALWKDIEGLINVDNQDKCFEA